MESRKLISFGNSSYVVSLPKNWVTTNHLKKGDTLQLDMKEGELLISAGSLKKEEPRKCVIDISNKNIQIVSKEITMAYLNNYDTIYVRGKGVEEKGMKLKKIARNLSGLEIIQQTAQSITFKDLLNLEEISVTTLVRRMDNIVRSMLIDTIDCLNKDHFESVYERDMDVNRLMFLAKRVIRAGLNSPRIAKAHNTNNRELLFNWNVVGSLEDIGDNTKRIARHIKKHPELQKQADVETFRGILMRLYNSYLEVMKAYYKEDSHTALQVAVDGYDRTQLFKLFAKEHGLNAYKVIPYLAAWSREVEHIANSVIGMKEYVGKEL